MILPSGNLFMTDTTLQNGVKAIEIVREKLTCAILGVEFEREGDENNVDIVNCNKPIVSCMIHNVKGVHLYEVDLVDKTIELYKK